MSEPQEIKKHSRGGARPGAGRPKGIPQREGQKNASRAHLIKKRLLDHGVGKVELSATQVKALEVLLDRLEPKLSAIEHTDANPRDLLDAGQLAAQLASMFNEKPELLAQIQELMRGAHATNAVQQGTSENSDSSTPLVTH